MSPRRELTPLPSTGPRGIALPSDSMGAEHVEGVPVLMMNDPKVKGKARDKIEKLYSIAPLLLALTEASRVAMKDRDEDEDEEKTLRDKTRGAARRALER